MVLGLAYTSQLCMRMAYTVFAPSIRRSDVGPGVTYISENWLGKFLSRVRRITHYTEAETASQ